MESFVHLRKGRTPKRLHADLDGLKDDELGRPPRHLPILDESDPSKRDPDLDLYNPDNPNQPPHTAEFLGRYREAQVARNRRITMWVKEKLAKLSEDGRPDDEFAFVVHGTMADPPLAGPDRRSE